MLRVLIKAYQKLSAAQSQTKQQVQVRLLNIDSFSHSFWRLTQRLFKRLLLRGAPSPVTDKKEGLQRDVKFGRVGHQQGTQLKGEIIPCRWTHNRKGPSLHNSQMGTRDQKLTPRSRTQHPTCGQNRHWAAEVAQVRRGAAKDTMGDHCSDTILYPLRYRQPMEYITHVGSDGSRKLGQPPNKTGIQTQNSVHQSQGTKRRPSQQRTAAVNTAGYKRVDKGESGLVDCCDTWYVVAWPGPTVSSCASLRLLERIVGGNTHVVFSE